MDIRPILSTLMRHKTAASLIVIEIALTCAIICNALFMISDRIREVREVSGLVEDELVRVQILSIGSDADRTQLGMVDQDPSQVVAVRAELEQLPHGQA